MDLSRENEEHSCTDLAALRDQEKRKKVVAVKRRCVMVKKKIKAVWVSDKVFRAARE